MEFLGHHTGGDVITLSSDNLEKVRKTPCPTTKKQVRSFLGLVAYYRDHIPAFAEISAPLSDLLKKGKLEQVQWNEAQEYLLQEPVLKLPDLMKPFVLRTDASGVCSENRCIWNQSSSSNVTGERRKVVPSRLCRQEVEPSRS